MKSLSVKFSLLILVMVIMIIILMFFGQVNISASQILSGNLAEEMETILWDIRFPKIITALLAGGALAAAGLVMQTYFNNPLAGPFILGVHSGASLGVAIGIMATNIITITLPGYFESLGTVFFAICGSLITLVLLMFLARKLSGNLILLVMGLVFGHIANGIINILIAVSDSHKIKNFLLWTMGSFQRVSKDQLIIYALILGICLTILFLFSKRLNLLLLGDNYAKTSGMNVEQNKYLFLLITAILSGTVTAFCGPVAFIGIMTPHLVRGFLKTTNHFIMIPGVIIFGSILAMLSEILANYMGDITLPTNAVLGLMGGPVILFLLTGRKRMKIS